ncbi:MAG TPA: prepilin-type N-terminal cleavage/methylation domain-containing protein [Gemmatimonadales bacterium]|jgi:prepilin-type N-terminal cleavage/methylation domain-containing protein
MIETPRTRTARLGRTLGTRGVTLLELVIVIVMIGILSGAALTHLDWRRYQADAAARGAMAELATAQRVALSLQTNTVITFPDSGRMEILEDANDNGGADAGERVRIVPLDNNFSYGQSTAPAIPAPDDGTAISTVTFHRDGSADHSGTLYVHGPGYDPNCAHCRAIAISRSTGRVVWYSYATGSWKRAN